MMIGKIEEGAINKLISGKCGVSTGVDGGEGGRGAYQNDHSSQCTI